jgi:hypothetical protein
MNFHELDLQWRILIIFGCISFFIILALIIFIILIFKTDLISIDYLVSTQETNIEKYDDFFKLLDQEYDQKPDQRPSKRQDQKSGKKQEKRKNKNKQNK